MLIEWPIGEPEPTKYWLSTLPDATVVEHLVHVAKMRWRIERDYQDLKQELGLGHFEGRGWRGFHHHAFLCIAAYGFLVAQRLNEGGKKKLRNPQRTCFTHGVHPTRLPSECSDTYLTPSQRCAGELLLTSPSDFRHVRIAPLSTCFVTQ